MRDLKGYANHYPDVRWPGDARVAVSVVLNIEEGAELLLSAGDERNEAIHEAIHQVEGASDLCLESHFEYGVRVGYWRICELADHYGVPLTLNACARALEATSWVGEDAAQRGYEIQCHGKPPVGWHTKSSASVNTRRLLVEHGGFLYDSDAYNDDAPYYVQVARTPHLVLPYAFVRGSDFAGYVIDAFDWLWEEGARQPKMLSIGLHTRIIGRAARVGGLAQVLQHLQAKGGVWFARREDIARYWLKEVPPR